MPNKKEILVLIVSVILGAMVTGGGIFGYLHYFQSSERISPERAIQKMTEEMAGVKSLEYSGQIEVEGEMETNGLAMPFPLVGKGDFPQTKQPSPAKQTVKFSIDFSGASDMHDLNNPKIQLKFSINTNLLSQRFGLEVRTIDKIGYLKLDNLPDLGFDVSFLKDQWIKADLKAMKKEQLKEVQKEQELSPEQKKEIEETITEAKIFKITKELPDEKIEGVDTYHYKFSINKERVIQLFTKISKIIQNKSLTEKELEKLNKSLEEAIESAEVEKSEIWIGKEDFLLYKLLVGSTIKETEKTKSEGKFTIQAQFKNYNEPVQIDIPKSTKPFEEVLGALLGGALSKGMQGVQPNIKLESK